MAQVIKMVDKLRDRSGGHAALMRALGKVPGGDYSKDRSKLVDEIMTELYKDGWVIADRDFVEERQRDG